MAERMCHAFAVLLEKSADTEINEAQHVLKRPRRDRPEGAMVGLTHLVIPQARRTHEVLLDKSFWLLRRRDRRQPAWGRHRQ